jgi:hypothetical protein
MLIMLCYFSSLTSPSHLPRILTCIKTAIAYCYKSNSNVIMLLYSCRENKLTLTAIGSTWGKKLQRIASRRHMLVASGGRSWVICYKTEIETKKKQTNKIKTRNWYIISYTMMCTKLNMIYFSWETAKTKIINVT